MKMHGDRQTYINDTGGEVDRQTDRHTARKADREKDRQTDRHRRDIQIDRQATQRPVQTKTYRHQVSNPRGRQIRID